jgi:cytochrome c-type biogenesis protein CcmF
MITGLIAIAIAFVTAVISMTAYILYYQDKQENLLLLANRSFYLMTAGIGFSMFLLLYSILTHNFQLNYVYSYSSTALNKFYLFSTLWAGQEGTFLLWLLYGCIYGVILVKIAARKNPLAMVFLLSVQAILLLILLKKNPFTMVWHVFEDVQVGLPVHEGRGLNPLLQNPWMVIHPPTLFIGYSSTVVPFVFAMSAMVRKDWHNWIKDARPWVIFNVMILGVGIIMGGYWAYVTLGWGGYWGWDPVENASLVPWFFSLILLHGILIQGKRKSLVKTNFVLAGIAFLTMLWGSFLTRSGVLTDFSVHSFGASGLSFYLIIFQALFTGLFLAVFLNFALRTRKNKEDVVRFSGGFLNRESFMLAGMLVLLLIGIVVLAGTSAPIYTAWFGEASGVSPDFYNSMIQPMVILMLIFVSIAPLLAWKTSEFRNVKTVAGSALGSLLLTAAAFLLGLTHPVSILLFFLAAFVIFVNLKVSFIFVKRNFPKAGAYFAHVGFGFMVIGIITSSLYDSSEKVMLPQGEYLKTDLGHEVQFVKFVSMPDGRDRIKLLVKTAQGGEYEAYPQFYYSEYSQAYMVSPDVNVQFARDIYISPISFMPARFTNHQEITLDKNDATPIGDIQITFNKFLVNMAGNDQEVTVDLTVQTMENGYPKKYNLLPILKAQNGEMSSTEEVVPNTQYRIRVASVSANTGQVTLSIISPNQDGQEAKDMLAIEVSEKPLISVLWFGTIVFALGAILALADRLRQKSRSGEAA